MKSFRAFAQPFSVWDFAYFSQNHNPAIRSTSAHSCAGSSSTWYDCQTVFHNEDRVIGDAYFRNADSNDDDTIVFMRGGPSFSGRVMWRGLRNYDYGGSGLSNSEFQTRGGSNNPPPPVALQGFRPYSKETGLFTVDTLTDRTTRWFRGNADIILLKQTGFAYKLVFRNDLDIDLDGVWENESRVTSRINHETNDGSRVSSDPGFFYIYRVPWSSPPTQAQKKARFTATA
ncbi:MAG: hypothetical protein M5R36_12585 [Deltaproteobacteria bacterium]|nr:hypothetical protein [Deltaproteobacteria bacterium]